MFRFKEMKMYFYETGHITKMAQSSRKRQIERIFTPIFAVVRQINPEVDSTVRLFFIVTMVNKMTKDQYTE